jgi:hypothetical protein
MYEFPTLTLDLASLNVGQIKFAISPGMVAILTLKLIGIVEVKKVGSHSNVTLDTKSYRIEGQNKISNFVTAHPFQNKNPKNISKKA